MEGGSGRGGRGRSGDRRARVEHGRRGGGRSTRPLVASAVCLASIVGLVLIERDGPGGAAEHLGDGAVQRAGRGLFATSGPLAVEAATHADSAPSDAPADEVVAPVEAESAADLVGAGEPLDRAAQTRAWYLENIEGWIDDLRDDHRRENASRARNYLRADVPEIVPALLTALRSDDKQQRHYAAHLLIERGLEPTADLIEVLVDDLRHDALYERNAQDAVTWLDDHLDVARHRLGVALLSDDVQQRFTAAYLLARGGFHETRAAACEILIEHLGDNDMPRDAELAREALTQLSYLVLPQVLVAHRNATDRQALDYLDRIQRDILRRAADPASSRPEHLGTNSYLPYRWIGWSFD
jgi:broad specificity phosphatase PhoE